MSTPYDFTELPDGLWAKFELFKRKRSGGSPPISSRNIMNGIIFRLKTGCPWSMIPKCYGSKSIINEHYRRWAKHGVFDQLMKICLEDYHRKQGVHLSWQSMDSSLIQAHVRIKKDAAEGLGANSTDRGRSGTEIHLQVDQKGTPLGIIVVGANVHDTRLVGLTIENNSDFVSVFNICTGNHHLCLDKGYDYPRVHEGVYAYGFEAHIRSRGEEKVEKQEGLHPARRWVVECTFAWLKGFRGIRTRDCRYLSTFIAFVKLACAILVFRKIHTKQ